MLKNHRFSQYIRAFGYDPALDQRGIIAGTVACMSARIGDGESIYLDGVLSHVNEAAKAAGGAVGMPAKAFIDSLVTK